MQAIQAIVDTYVRLRNEAALLALKQQRLKVLGNVCPERSDSTQDCAASVWRRFPRSTPALRDCGRRQLVVPAPPPSPPRTSPPSAKEARDPPPFQPVDRSIARSDRTVARTGHRRNTPALLTPIDPSPFPAAAEPSPPILAAPSPVPAAADPPSINVPTEPPQPFAASHVASSLLASTLLSRPRFPQSSRRGTGRSSSRS